MFVAVVGGLACGTVGADVILSVEKVREVALEFNRDYLTAQQEIDKAESDIIRARAGALPDLRLNASYDRNLKIGSMFLDTVEIKTGFKNAFGASLSLRQAIWQGGKVFTAWAIAREYKKYAKERAAQVSREVVYNADVLFYSAVLAKSRLAVLEKAFETDSCNLDVVEKLYSQGLVSEYEVLRARVEKANLRPQILRAESELRLSQKRLASFIGMDLNEAIVLLEAQGDTSLVQLPPLAVLTDTAMSNRPDVRQSEHLTSMARKAIKVAKGGFYPSVDAVSTYAWQSQSDRFTMKDNESQSWSVGISVSMPLFNGGSTFGDVKQRKAEYEETRLAAAQLKDNIRLEVEQAYDQILQAKKALDIQGETIAQAEEGLKIANLRYETGVGTQLEVLSAQTALTQARQAAAEATFSFRQAHSQLTKATTIEIKTEL
jgi:outer membrane protein